MTPDKALAHAETVYKRLIAQGRSESDARRDAERYVEGNFGVKVSLKGPARSAEGHRCPRCVRGVPHEHGWTVDGHFTQNIDIDDLIRNFDSMGRAAREASASTAGFNTSADFWRDLIEQQARERESRRDTIKRDIDRLRIEHDDLIQQVESILGRYPKQPGDFARISSMLKQIARLEERIEWHKRQYASATG